MMNKGVFGTAYFVRNLLGSNNNNELQKSKGGSNNNYNGRATLSSFVFLGVSNYYILVSLLTENKPHQNLSLDLNDDIQWAIRVAGRRIQ
jgi:hypothetical protein